MPMRHSSSMTHPCRMQRWPTPTLGPIRTGHPLSVWMTVRSWMLLCAPTRIGSMSPRRTQPYQTLDSRSKVTRPTTLAPGAMKASGCTWGANGSSRSLIG